MSEDDGLRAPWTINESSQTLSHWLTEAGVSGLDSRGMSKRDIGDREGVGMGGDGERSSLCDVTDREDSVSVV